MDTVGTSVDGQIPLLESLPPSNEDGAGGDHVYAPWWLYREQLAGKLDFPRGYHIEFGTGRSMPSVSTFAGLDGATQGSYGRQFKQDARRHYGSTVGFSGRGEMIPSDRCWIELDPEMKDAWNVSVLRFHWAWSEHEIKQAVHMQATFAALIEAMGGTVQTALDARGGILPGGQIKHGVGGAMMGSHPATSVTNSYSQLWEAKNVMIADSATFCSCPDKNPTLTIMALAWRGCAHLLSEMRAGNL